MLIEKNSKTFEKINNLLEQGYKLYFHYDLMGVGEITSITKSNKLGFKDMKNNYIYLTEREFNEYNQHCDFDDIIKADTE